MSFSGLTSTALWERSLIPATGGSTSLVIKLEAAMPLTREVNRAAVDVVFVVDRSGSMSGAKLEMAKRGVLRAIDHLAPQDRAGLVIFDDRVDVLAPLAHLDNGVRTLLRQLTQRIEVAGSTNLGDGWLTGCRLIAQAEDPADGHRIKRVILLTDGLTNVGIVDPTALGNHARELRQRGISTTTLGIGEGFDETLLAGMAEAGGGNFQFIRYADDLPGFFQRELGELLMIGAAAIRLQLTTPDGVRAWLVSAFDHHRRGNVRTIEVGDLAAGDEAILVFDVTVEESRVGKKHKLSIEVSWIDPVTAVRHCISQSLPTLTSAKAVDVEAIPFEAYVQEQTALQHAAKLQREAMRLDRQGRWAESRAAHGMAAQRLGLLKDKSELVQARLDEAQYRAAFDSTVPFSEEERKLAEWEGFNRQRRTRGEAPRQ